MDLEEKKAIETSGMDTSSKPRRLTDKEVNESCVSLLETFQAKVNGAVHERGLKGDEPHVLNVINTGLFGLLCQARLFVPHKKEVKKS